jgi:hypothetical protein
MTLEQQTQAQPQPTQPVAQPAQAQPEPGAEFRSMSPEAFAARLKAERDAGLKAALATIGVDSLDTAKAKLEALAKAEQAQLTEQQRLAKQLEELAPLAAKAKAYEATIAATLEAEEKALPEGKRSLLALAPESPAERLAWLAKAKATGLFAEAGPAAVQPVTTRAGGTAPAPKQPTPAKAPKDMTPAEFEEYKRSLFGG